MCGGGGGGGGGGSGEGGRSGRPSAELAGGRCRRRRAPPQSDHLRLGAAARLDAVIPRGDPRGDLPSSVGPAACSSTAACPARAAYRLVHAPHAWPVHSACCPPPAASAAGSLCPASCPVSLLPSARRPLPAACKPAPPNPIASGPTPPAHRARRTTACCTQPTAWVTPARCLPPTACAPRSRACLSAAHCPLPAPHVLECRLLLPVALCVPCAPHVPVPPRTFQCLLQPS